jgi:hypothetical protein
MVTCPNLDDQSAHQSLGKAGEGPSLAVTNSSTPPHHLVAADLEVASSLLLELGAMAEAPGPVEAKSRVR